MKRLGTVRGGTTTAKRGADSRCSATDSASPSDRTPRASYRAAPQLHSPTASDLTFRGLASMFHGDRWPAELGSSAV